MGEREGSSSDGEGRKEQEKISKALMGEEERVKKANNMAKKVEERARKAEEKGRKAEEKGRKAEERAEITRVRLANKHLGRN